MVGRVSGMVGRVSGKVGRVSGMVSRVSDPFPIRGSRNLLLPLFLELARGYVLHCGAG